MRRMPDSRCALCAVRCALCAVRCALCAVRCALCAVRCPLTFSPPTTQPTPTNQAAGKRPPARKALSRRPDRVAESSMLGRVASKAPRAVNQQHLFGHVPGIQVGFKCVGSIDASCLGVGDASLTGVWSLKVVCAVRAALFAWMDGWMDVYTHAQG